MTLNPFYVKEGDNFELREPRRNRLVFLNEDAITPMGAAFSLDCDISSITERVDENGMPTNEADLTVKYYDDNNEMNNTSMFEAYSDKPHAFTDALLSDPNNLKISNESVELKFFDIDELVELDIVETHRHIVNSYILK